MIFCVSFSMFTPVKAAELWKPPSTPTCRAVFFVNEDTGTVLYSSHEKDKIYPASITKLMTAMLVYEKYKDNLNTKITVEKDDLSPLVGSGGSVVGLKVGEQLTVEQLLYCLLVRSGDDSANVLARATGGSIEDFVDMMNEKAKALGLNDTHYVNPHGLHDDDHYTTAYDTYLLAKNAMKIDLLAKIVSQPSYTLAATNKSGKRFFSSTNFVINPSYKTFYYKYVKGIKTGTTTPAGSCLVSYAENDGVTYYCVTMGGVSNKTKTVNTAFSETKMLYKWAFTDFEITPIVKTTDTPAQVNLELAVQKTKLLLVPQKQINELMPKSFKTSDLKITLHVPDSVKAPIKKGDKIGTEDISIMNLDTKKLQKIATVDLVAKEDAELSQPLYILATIKSFFNSVWFKIVAVLLVLMLVAYISLSVYYNERKKRINRRRRKKFTYKR